MIKTPLKIKNTLLSNRVVMPPMATTKTEDGFVNDDIVAFYDERSKDNLIGLFIIEHSYINIVGKAHKSQLAVDHDDKIEGLKKIADIIHLNGSKCVLQISHAGSVSDEKITGCKPVSASAVCHPKKGNIPLEMTKEDIKDLIEDFKQAAIRAEKAGFDGIELHSAHSYLLDQFYSPLTNKRTDEYGSSLENRIRLHLEIIREIKQSVSDDFLLFIRLGASDYMEGGVTIEDSKIASKAFEKEGVDVIDVSGGMCGYSIRESREGYFSDLTEEIKSVVNIPVVLTGGIKSLKTADELLTESKADLIGIGRKIFGNPKWIKKQYNL